MPPVQQCDDQSAHASDDKFFFYAKVPDTDAIVSALNTLIPSGAGMTPEISHLLSILTARQVAIDSAQEDLEDQLRDINALLVENKMSQHFPGTSLWEGLA